MGDEREPSKSHDTHVVHAPAMGAADAVSGGKAAESDKPELKPGADKRWRVFASNGLPFLVRSAGGSHSSASVWVVREWVTAASDFSKHGKDYISPSRAREVLSALGWVKNLDYAAQNLVFHFPFPGVNLLVLGASGEHATGLPTGKIADWNRTVAGGIDVIFANPDRTVLPDTDVVVNEHLLGELQRGLEKVTKLHALPEAAALLRSKFQKLKTGNGTLLFELDRQLCEQVFGKEAYDGWLNQKKERKSAPDEPKVKLENYYQRPVPGRLIQHGDIIEDGEKVWFEVEVEWPGDVPSSAFFAVPPRTQKGHRGRVSRLHCDWTFERVSTEIGKSYLPQAAPQPVLGGNTAGGSTSTSNDVAASPASASSGVSTAKPAASQQSKIEPLGKSAAVPGMEFQSTVLAEVAHKFKLGPGEDVGRFRVSVQAGYPEYFESALFTEEFEVKSRTRAMAELRTAAFADVAARNEHTEKTDFGGWLGGSGNDIHGFRTTGDLPEGFQPSAPAAPPTLAEIMRATSMGETLPMDPRTAQRAAQRQRLVDVRAYLEKDPNAAAALKSIDLELERFDKAEAALETDRYKGWQPFEVRGTYLAREEGVPSGPLDLYGTVHTHFVAPASKGSVPRLDIVVQIRDMSKRFDNSDMTFTGRGADFESALRAAFVDCAKAYPDGELAIQAEAINDGALPRDFGDMGGGARAGTGSVSTGKVIGFQLGTDSRWKRVKEKVWSPIANIAVNLGAIALMAFVPASAAIVAPLLIAYNTIPIVDNMAQESARGTLTWGTALTSVGAIALNVLPMLGQAKAFSGAWFALEGANWGGQAVLLTADALAQARQLQGQDVAALAQMYKELMELGPADASSPRAKALQAEIAERAHAVSGRIQESFRDLVGQNIVIAVAGSVVHRASARTRAAIVAGLPARLPSASVHAGGEGVGERLGGSTGTANEPPPSSGGQHVGEGKPSVGSSAQSESIGKSAPTDRIGQHAEAASTGDRVERDASEKRGGSPDPAGGALPLNPLSPEREAALRESLPPALADIPIVGNPELRGKSAQVRYRDGEVVLEVGPETAARQVAYHVSSAKRLLAYRGPLGIVRKLMSRVLHLFGTLPGYGSHGFESRLEVKKLRAIEADIHGLRAQIEQGALIRENGVELNQHDLQLELLEVQEQLEFHERRLDSFEQGLGVVAAHSSGRVNEMVPGLYGSIDPNHQPKGWTFTDDPASLSTTITAPNGASGTITRKFDKTRGQWVLDSAFFGADLPRWIDAGTPMVPGKGTPLLAYLDMRLMKRAGVAEGSLRQVKLSTIQNIETICQLAKLTREGMPQQEAIHLTHSVAYASTEISQSGHRIEKIELDGGVRSVLDRLLSHYETHPDPAVKKSRAYHDAILAKYGVNRSDVVFWNFDILIDLTSAGSP